MQSDILFLKFTPLGTIAAALLFCSLAYGQVNDTAAETVSDSALTRAPAATLDAAPAASLGALFSPGPNVLFDNGPLVNSAGTGAGGADESVLQNGSLGMNTFGLGHQVNAGNRVADDFTVPAGGWVIDSFTFFAYETFSPLTSTFTAVNIRIWDGVPGEPGSNIVFGDTTTNVMTDTVFTSIYRVTETSLGNTSRPIMAQTAGALDLFLEAGTYWVDWQTAGDPAFGGPWAPPITINGETDTGNGLQSTDNGATYGPALDSGTNSPQGFPFLITGTEPERLSCEGFQFPMNTAVTIRRFNSYPPYFDQPSVLPLTMRLLDESGKAVFPQDLSSEPVVEVLFDGFIEEESVDGYMPISPVPEELPYVSFGNDGNRFEFNQGFWRFYLGTREFGATGTYYVAVISSDETEYQVDPTCVGTFTIVNPFSFGW